MAPKKSASKAPGAQQEAKMRAQHNKELSDLASKARRDAFDASAAGQAAAYVRVSVVLALLGIYAQASQLALSPVYGGIPASVSHAGVLAAGCFLGWAGNLALRHALPNSLSAARLLPVAAAWAPISRLLVDGLSEQLGVFWGPLATEAVTLVPVAVLSAACVADGLEGRKVTELLPAAVADSLPGIGSWAGFKLAEAAAAAWLRPRVGSVFLYTRMGLEMLLAASYAALAPSRWLALAVPALLHTVAFNTHVQVPWATATLNATVAADGWLLLDRAESLTGYLSVLENTERKFRVLRCDHSLLGGQWVMPMGPGQTVAEPIYGIFVMLEAVRLAEPPRGVAAVADDDAKALVIGLGIGTAPSALVAHGIDTTVVEIDPGVHELAVKHFDVLENNPPVFEDAVSYTGRRAAEDGETFDYIIHDVFTGGAEPLELFTLEFLQGLSALLKPNGVVAINYAGDLGLPSPKIIVRTIAHVFPTCRIFRELPPDQERLQAGEPDFTNMVIFCRKTAEQPITFRRSRAQDRLMSRVREVFLDPKNEVQQLDFLKDDSAVILARNNTGDLTKWHRASAAGHWAIMRGLIPPKIWEKW